MKHKMRQPWRKRCRAAGAAFWFKQATNDGSIPPDLLVREWPEGRA